MEAVPDYLKAYVNNYKMHLVNVRELKDTGVFKTDLRQVFEFIRCSEDKAALKKLVKGNPDYACLGMDAYDVMMAHAHSKELKELRNRVEKEGGNVCKGLADWAAEERAEGRAEGALYHLYKMVARGRRTVQDALEDLENGISETEFLAGMQAAGFKVP